MLRTYLELPPAVHLLCLGMFLNRLGSFLLPFLTKFLKHRFGVGDDWASIGMTCFGIGAIVAALVGGHFADWKGRKPVLFGALAFGAGVLMLIPQLNAVWQVLLVVFLYAVIGEQFRPALQAMIADLVEPAKRTHAFGLMYISINLGFGIGPLIGGLLAERSYDYLFYGQALASLCFGIVVLAFVPETLKRRPQSPSAGVHAEAPAVSEPARDRAQDAPSEPHVGFFAAFGQIIRDYPFLLFCMGTFFISVVFMQMMSSFSLFLESKGFGNREYGRIIAVNGLVIAAAQIFVSAAVARFDPFRMLALASLLTSLGFGLKMAASSEAAFMMTVVIWTFGEMMQSPLLAPVVSEIAPRRLRARYLGLVTIAFSGANALGAPLGGWILARYGGVALWTATACVALLGGFFYWLSSRALRARMTPRIVSAAD